MAHSWKKCQATVCFYLRMSEKGQRGKMLKIKKKKDNSKVHVEKIPRFSAESVIMWFF